MAPDTVAEDLMGPRRDDLGEDFGYTCRYTRLQILQVTYPAQQLHLLLDPVASLHDVG